GTGVFGNLYTICFAEDSSNPRTLEWRWEGHGEAAVIADETRALSHSGYITFSVPSGLAPTALHRGGEPLYHLRVLLQDAGCEERVTLAAVETGRYRAAQQETRSQIRAVTVKPSADCPVLFDDALAAIASFTVFLREEQGWRQAEAGEVQDAEGHRGIRLNAETAADDGAANLLIVCADPIHYADLFRPSSGLPDQTLPLSLGGRQALPERFRLICDTLEEDGSLRPEIWHCVEDLYACGPRDRVFVYDPLLELIRFGNGRSGAIVPRGEHAILLADLVLSDCAQGNIPEGQRLRFAEDETAVWNTAAVGGADRESTAEAAARFLRRLEHPHKCVSAADYEREALQTPGLRVASARAIPGYDPKEPTGRSRHPVVTVVVIPANQERRPLPDERFLSAVHSHLNRYRPVGTVVRVMAPRYIGVTVSAQLRTSMQVEEAAVRRAVERCLTVGRGGRSIGDPVSLHEISTALQQAPEVQAVERVQLTVDSAGCSETATGDILLPKHAVAYLKGLLLTQR
ncbi:MAG: baseplate J/gp47 family protein, partial [Clostridia bacterium]|nr:baseplate J/gp47 family protein [Clostridia bacterium]